LAASSQPARAKLQKFAALLLTNASFSFLPDGAEPEELDFFHGLF
jgi:hypothetical protein